MDRDFESRSNKSKSSYINFFYTLPEVLWAPIDLNLAGVSVNVSANPHVASQLEVVVAIMHGVITKDLVVVGRELPRAVGLLILQILNAAVFSAAHVPQHDSVTIRLVLKGPWVEPESCYKSAEWVV